MVKQGTIIKINFDPQKGHEQAGYRPAVVISNNDYNKNCNMTILCPITNTNKPFPLHIPLDNRTKTTGFVLCEHVRSLDLSVRPYDVVEMLPKDVLQRVLNVVIAEIEIA